MIAGCATGRPISQRAAAEHDAEARSNAEVAQAHQRAAREAPPCLDMADLVCWSEPDTREFHESLATRHLQRSSAHARRARALRAAEKSACVGIAQEDRDVSPFLRSKDILRVELLDPAHAQNELTIPVARVSFSAVPGLDEPKLRHLIACHLARNAALGHDVPEMEYCPLVPRGVSATVTAGGQQQLAVTLTADESSFAEVRRRAQVLAQRVDHSLGSAAG